MKLCLISKFEIDQLEKMALDLFASVTNKNVVIPDLGEPKPYDERNLSHFYKFVPVKDKDVLSFVWFLPYTQKEYKT